MSDKPLDAPMTEEERADRLERMVDTLAGTIVDLKAQLAGAKDLIDRAEGLVVDYLLDGEPDKQLIPFSPWMERLAQWRRTAGGT